MYSLIVIALLFFGGALFNFSEGDMFNGIGNLIITVIFISIYRLLHVEKKKSKEFIQWISANKNLIYEGRAFYNDSKIFLDSELTQFQYCMSFGVLSVKISSRYYIDTHHNITLMNIVYSVITCILGWWGLPLGPIYTIQTLISNLRGGRKVAVSSILANNKECI